MAKKQIGPFNRGMDMLSTDESMPRTQDGHVDVCVDALNFEFNREGWFDTRPCFTGALQDDPGYWHSGCTATSGKHGYAVAGNVMYRIDLAIGAIAATATAIFTMPSEASVSFDDLNGETVFTSRDYLGVIGADDVVRPLCMPDGYLPMATATAGSGGLPGGRYSVALGFVEANGREGGLSAIRTVNVPDGGGITIKLPPALAPIARIYRTPLNGGKLYAAADVPLPGSGTYLLGSGALGADCETQFLRALMPGDYVRLWKGLLLVARGPLLTVSMPMTYHLTSPRHNFMMFRSNIAFVEGVDNGIYVGLVGDGVVFLRGNTPGEFEYKADIGGNVPFPGSSIKVHDDLFDPQLQLGGRVAIWLAENGYVIGRGDGQLYEPQAQRIQLSATASGRTAIVGRRVVTIVNA